MEKNISASQLDPEVRKGPWTMEEDLILINHIANHGQGVWNDLARSAGLKRTGKSCRLRWLNYLRPDVRRGNITPEEQMLIIELHSRWGNRWSKIAKQIPGRTDNEIKNFWRTRIQKKKNKKKEGTSFEDYSSGAPIDHRRPEEEEEASASFVGGGGGSSITMEDGGMEFCSPSINISDGQDALMTTESPSDLGDGFWAVDDLWSMQF